MAASVLATLIGVVALCLLRSRGVSLWRCKPLVWGVAGLHVAALIIRMLYAEGADLPHSLLAISYALAQSGGMLFLIYASMFFEVGFEKSIPAVALGFVVSGALQIVALSFHREIALGLILILAPLSALMILLAGKRVVGATALTEMNNSAAIQPYNRLSDEKTAQGLQLVFCAIILLVATLLKDVQGAAVPHLAGDRLLAQCSIGLGGILAGLFVLAVERRIAARLLAFPMLLVALVLLFFTLYLSVLVSEHAWVYLMFQGICYTALLFSTLVISSAALTKNTDLFIQTCAAYLSFRIGLSLGTIILVIIPATAGSLFKTALTLALSVALVALCAMALLKCLKTEASQDARGKQAGSESPTERACLGIAREYALTPRETEVLFLLAKGRNAQHIAKALTLSPGTVKTHTAHIYQKTGVQSQQALMDLVEHSG